jgi:hypothetical protein
MAPEIPWGTSGAVLFMDILTDSAGSPDGRIGFQY